MPSKLLKFVAIALVGIASVHAKTSCPSVSHDGTPTGQLKNISGTQIYHAGALPKTGPESGPKNGPKNGPGPKNVPRAILYVTDIFGVPAIQNKLLADSIARAGYPVIMPDLFEGDAIPDGALERGFNMSAWLPRHGPAQIDSIIAKTITYMKTELGVQSIGAVGYCFGGKYVPRFMVEGKGIDVGFIAHPSFLEKAEIQGIDGPISIAAGQFDDSFNATAKRNAEAILESKNAIFQSTLYAQAVHGFAVRANLSIPAQKFAKDASYLQAVTWFDAWL